MEHWLRGLLQKGTAWNDTVFLTEGMARGEKWC